MAARADRVSYISGFINVILYNYDRFVLPMCFVLAIFGGLTLDRVLSQTVRWRRLGSGVVAAAFAYTLLYAGTVDVLMTRRLALRGRALDEGARAADGSRGDQRLA